MKSNYIKIRIDPRLKAASGRILRRLGLGGWTLFLRASLMKLVQTHGIAFLDLHLPPGPDPDPDEDLTDLPKEVREILQK